MRRRTKIGLGLTAVWLLIFGAMVIRDLDAALAMKLNELGDLLAGASAPLALFWLVIGYLQHGEELRLNTRALNAQKEELGRQVAETAILAGNAERQARATEDLAQQNKEGQEREALRQALEAQPELIGAGGSSSGAGLLTNIVNRGGEAKDIELICERPHRLGFSPKRRLDSGGKAMLTVWQGEETLRFPIRFSIGYTDKFGSRHKRDFELRENHELREIPDGK